MLLFADMVVITKADVVSQAEREVFAFRAREANRKARFLFVNGLTGEGTSELARFLKDAPGIGPTASAGPTVSAGPTASTDSLNHSRMRFPLPSALCSYCLGETRIGEDYVTNSVIARKIEIPEEE
jgi:hypothetical protein